MGLWEMAAVWAGRQRVNNFSHCRGTSWLTLLPRLLLYYCDSPESPGPTAGELQLLVAFLRLALLSPYLSSRFSAVYRTRKWVTRASNSHQCSSKKKRNVGGALVPLAHVPDISILVFSPPDFVNVRCITPHPGGLTDTLSRRGSFEAQKKRWTFLPSEGDARGPRAPDKR